MPEKWPRSTIMPVPTDEEARKYGPLGAVARKVKEKYLGEEDLQQCLKRNIGNRFTPTPDS